MPRRKKAEIRRGREAGTKNAHKYGGGVTLYTKPGRDAEGRLVAVYYGKVSFVEPATGTKIAKRRALKDEAGEPITTRPEAEAALVAFQAEIRKEYLLDETDKVQRQREIAARVKTAEDALREKEEERRLAREAKDALRIADAFPRYRLLLAKVHERRRKVVDAGTVDRYEAQFTAFENWIEANHPEIVAVRDVSPALAQEWLDSLSALSGNSLNKRIVLMRSVWNTLGPSVWFKPAEKGAIPFNPWEGSKRGGTIDKAKADTVGKEPFTDEEAGRLLDLAEGEVKTLAFLAAYTGARLGDCVRFKWNMIDFTARTVSFTPNKTLHTSGRKVVLPLFPELADHLRTLRGFALGRGSIVPGLLAEYEKDAPGFLHKYLEPLYAKAEIETRAEGIDGKLHTVKAWHSWRHYFATRALQAGVAPAEVQRMLGWTSEQMLKVYFNPETKRILARMDATGKALPAPAGAVAALPAPKSAKVALAAFEAACRALASAGLSPADWRKAETILKNSKTARRA